MKSMTLLLSVLFSGVCSVAFLTGCASSDGEMEAFVGQPSSELLARLGPPKLRVPDGKGGQIWTYMDEGSAPGAYQPTLPIAPLGSGAASRASSLDSRGFSAKREFLIDANGTIYQHRGRM